MSLYEQMKAAFAAGPPASPDDAAAVRRFLYAPSDDLSIGDVVITEQWTDGAMEWARRRFGEPPLSDTWKDEVIELVRRGDVSAADVRAAWPDDAGILERLEGVP